MAPGSHKCAPLCSVSRTTDVAAFCRMKAERFAAPQAVKDSFKPLCVCARYVRADVSREEWRGRGGGGGTTTAAAGCVLWQDWKMRKTKEKTGTASVFSSKHVSNMIHVSSYEVGHRNAPSISSRPLLEPILSHLSKSPNAQLAQPNCVCEVLTHSARLCVV